MMQKAKPTFWIRKFAGRVSVLLVLATLLTARPASAVDEGTRAALRELGTEGVQAYQAGDYEAARQKLEEAFSIMRTAPLGLWSARALEKLGLLVQASERYLAAERSPLDPEGDQQAQLDARSTAAKEREALQPRIPHLKVTIAGAKPGDVTLVVAGKEVPAALVGKSLLVNPGRVEVTARRGEEEVSGSEDIAEGETKELVLTLSDAAPAAGTPAEEQAHPGEDKQERSLFARKWPAFLAAGVAVAGGVVWTVFGVQSMDAKSRADACPSTSCTADQEQDFRQQAWDAGNMATVGMVMTGVGVVGATVLWITLPGADGPKESALSVGPLERLQLGVRPAGIQLRGVF
jgi:hypothetical protein